MSFTFAQNRNPPLGVFHAMNVVAWQEQPFLYNREKRSNALFTSIASFHGLN
jgi:hypothetical protein